MPSRYLITLVLRRLVTMPRRSSSATNLPKDFNSKSEAEDGTDGFRQAVRRDHHCVVRHPVHMSLPRYGSGRTPPAVSSRLTSGNSHMAKIIKNPRNATTYWIRSWPSI